MIDDVLDQGIMHTKRRDLRQSPRDPLLHRLPCLLRESLVHVRELAKWDKSFACAWLNERYVVIGTKCNSLLLVDAHSSRAVWPIALPPQPPRPTPSLQAHSNLESCGIHCLATSPDGGLLATGGDNPNDCQIWSVGDADCAWDTPPQLRPLTTLVGHKDWIFGVSWLTDRHVVTGSRDGYIKLWSADGSGLGRNRNAAQRSRRAAAREEGRVRDVKWNDDLGRIASLDADGTVRLWDAELELVQEVQLQQNKELVAMAMRPDMVAVGSQCHVALLDPRCCDVVSVVEGQKAREGVRSLQLHGHLLSAGSSMSALSFLDLRMRAWLAVDGPKPRPIQTQVDNYSVSQADEAITALQAEGHLPQQMDPAALQDARLALGGPNSEMVLSLLRAVAQQAADTGRDRAREQALWLSTERPGFYPQAVAALRAAGLVAQLGPPAEGGATTRDGRALQALAQDSDSELEPSDSESEGGHSNGYPADGRWFIDDWTRHNWTAGGADPDEVRHWLAMSQGHLEMNDVYRLHFFGQRILTACYAHAWDPSGTRIFMCGGPLAYGLRGNYAALWH